MKIKIGKDELVGMAALTALVTLVFYAGPAASPSQSRSGFNAQSETVLTVAWGDLGVKMTEAGVIDRQKFLALYGSDPLLREEARRLTESYDDDLEITPE